MNVKEGKKFITDIGWILLGNILIIAVTFLQRLFIARLMGAEELGAFSLIMSIYAIGTVLITVGLPAALTKYIAEIKNVEQKLRELSFAGLILTGTSGIFFACLFLIFSASVSKLLNISHLSNIVILLAFIFPFSTVFYTSLAILNGKREMKSYAIFQALQNILYLFITLIFLLFGYGLKSILLALWISISISATILIIKQRRYLFISIKIPNLILNVKRLIQFGIKVLSTDFVNQVNIYADVMLLGFFLSPEKVGYYTVAMSISRLIWVMPGCIQKITYPAASEYWTRNDNIRLNEMVNKTIKYSSIISIILGLGISFFARDIIFTVFGEGFEAALIPMLVLIWGIVLNGALIKSLGGLLAAIGRPELSLKVDTISVVINISLNLFLIPKYGILGAAIAKTFSLMSNTIIKICLFLKIVKLKLELKPFYLIAATAIVLTFIKWLINSPASSFFLFTIYILIIFKFYIYSEGTKFIKSFFK